MHHVAILAWECCCDASFRFVCPNAAAATVMALQSIVSRETDPLDSSVISVTQARMIVDLRITLLLLQLHI